MTHAEIPAASNAARGWFSWYRRTPLYVRILIGLALGVGVGYLFGKRTAVLKPLSDLVLQFLKLLATPLIFLAVVHALLRARGGGKTGFRLFYLLMTNTVVAILVGLLVANTIQPGRWAKLTVEGKIPDKKPFDPVHDLLDKLPSDFVEPFRKNEIISIIVLALATGIALRVVRAGGAGSEGVRILEEVLDTGFRCVMVMLHWIFDLVPFAVFAVVARTVGTQGIGPLLSMGVFVVAVVVALAIQAAYYLARLRMGSWVRPLAFLRGGSDALVMAFSTASSAATLPVTYACMKDNIGVREESAGLGVMVGGTFNHDGTALYEAMAALFVSQAMGTHLGFGEQVVVVLMSVIASVGAAGIPEAGLVTMLAVFSAVRLPLEYIPLLLPLDWFLDRCRTAINVMGDMSVTCLIDGDTPEVKPPPEELAA